MSICDDLTADIAAKEALTLPLQAVLITRQAAELAAQAALTAAMTALSTASTERMQAQNDLTQNTAEIDMLKTFKTSMGCP